MIKFEQGGKARLKHFGFRAEDEPVDGDYPVVGITPCNVKIDIGSEIIMMKIHNAGKWQWAVDGNVMMFTALA